MAKDGGTARPFTVVTITRNNLEGLRRTLDSLRTQDFRDVQHVIIDGASTDGSVEWLRTADVFDETVVVSEPDRGVYDAMNKGAALATGALLTFLNAGDAYAHPHVLSQAWESQRQRGWLWGFGLKRVVSSGGSPVRPVRSIRYSLRRHALGLIEIPHQATFMRKDFFESLGGFSERFPLAGDTDLLLRAGRMAPPEVWDSVDVVYEEGGISHQRVLRSTYERHLVRLTIPGAALHPIFLDLAWTLMQIARIAARRTGKRLLDRISGGRFTRWWAARGL